MRPSIAEQPTAVSASVHAELAVAEAVALLHAVTELEPTNYGNGRDEYIRSGLQTLAARASDDLILAFNQLDAIVGRKS